MRPSNEHEHTLDWCTGDDWVRASVKATPRNYSPTSTGAATTPAEAGVRHQPTPGARIRKDTFPARSTACQYATTVHITVRHTCNRLPLVYKRRRTQRHTRSPTLTTSHHSHIHDIGIHLNHPSRDLRLHLLSRLACSSPLQAPMCGSIQCARTLC
jgi:hypothetical protein